MPKEPIFISCDLVGGLGNQLFQVAATLSCALTHNMTPVFEKKESSPSVFQSRPVYWDSYLSNIQFMPSKTLSQFETVSESDFPHTELPKFNKSTLLKGYFQSPTYFNSNKKEILNILSLPQKKQDTIRQNHTQFFNTPEKTAIHIRRGDYLKLKKIHTVLSETDYYLKALPHIPDSSTLVIFSDDIQWCKKNFKKITTPRPQRWIKSLINKHHKDRKTLFIEDTDINELYLMSHCQNHIIANSSFSWWGAYMSKEKGVVIAPKQWFGKARKTQDHDHYLDNWKAI